MDKKDIIGEFIDALSQEPCYVLIFAIFIITAWIINKAFKHAKEISEINSKQLKEVLKNV